MEMEEKKSLGCVFSDQTMLLPFGKKGAEAFLADFYEKSSSLSHVPWTYGGTVSEKKFFWKEIPCDDILFKKKIEEQSQASFQSLREIATLYDPAVFSMASKVFHMRHWQKHTQFCGFCGGKTTFSPEEKQFRYCPACEKFFYPRISPAVIVRIEREDSILLARNVRFPKGMHSLIAGFVEPGESLEEALQREVMEEIGIEVKQITYFGSQTWPFPDSLMVGFTAQWKSGKIKVDHNEIAEAAWFSADTLPHLPGKGSIAHTIIMDWIKEKEYRQPLKVFR